MSAVRKSIKKYFPFPLGDMASLGSNSPLTLHDVDDDAFRAIWSLVAETMVVDGALTRTTKEAIADMVSERNECPVCATIHTMMKAAAMEGEGKSVGQNHAQALEYGLLVQDATLGIRQFPQDKAALKRMFDELTDEAMAEVALVVLLFQHMNRVVSAIMGEEMTTAMFKLPRTMAKKMER